jgi:hypothetical protein
MHLMQRMRSAWDPTPYPYECHLILKCDVRRKRRVGEQQGWSRRPNALVKAGYVPVDDERRIPQRAGDRYELVTARCPAAKW